VETEKAPSSVEPWAEVARTVTGKVPSPRFMPRDFIWSQVTVNGVPAASPGTPSPLRSHSTDVTGDPNGGPFRWRVWEGHERFVGDTFVPSPTLLRDYLPFFDQYAQTITPWAPDGSAFAYAGTHQGGSGIWVQPLAGRRRLIGDGAFVTWTPTPKG